MKGKGEGDFPKEFVLNLACVIVFMFLACSLKHKALVLINCKMFLHALRSCTSMSVT